ncbi:hypothetical protein WUBG_03889, partial [Wuchereria bancrofti]
MAPTGQSASWSDVLCCRICSELFSSKKLPINLACGHTICHNCLNELNTSSCPLDQTAISIPFEKLPPNLALLSILSEFINTKPEIDQELSDEYRHIESNLVELASYLHPVECLFGGSVWSDELSRPMQRKLISLLCYQLMEYKGLKRALKTARALAERALSELIIYHQNNSNISTILWSAIRSRGCQFLGPAMQEEILKLILLILSDGALMSRKTLVLYIVQTLREDYPQASKTCVGHVVQLLYRAGCFNVLKREGESSLMQLKTQFRHYDALRREHDAQIVQVAFQQGLRISPDQWSALLYGDQHHRSHMQSIIDKANFEQQVRDLKTAIEQCSGRDMLIPTFEHFERFANFDYLSELPDWTLAVHLFDSLLFIIKTYVKFTRMRSIARFIPATKCPSVCHHGDHLTRFSRNYPNPKGTAAGSICSASVKSTCVLAKNEFRTSIPQIQSHPLPVFIEPMPAVSLPTVLQSHLTEFPLFSTNTSSLDLSSAVGNNGFAEVTKSSVNLVRNLTPVAQPLSTPATPLVPLMMQAVNHFLSPPLFPVATLAQVGVPVFIDMTPISSVPSSFLQISPTRFEKCIFNNCLNDELYPIHCKIPMELPNLSYTQDNVHQVICDSCVQDIYASENNGMNGEQYIGRLHHSVSIDADESSNDYLQRNNSIKVSISTTVTTICSLLSQLCATIPVTVQAPCALMRIRNTIKQPLKMSKKQSNLPMIVESVPGILSNSESAVNNAEDKISNIKERKSVAHRNDTIGCSVEKQQLITELNIASKQIQ